MRFAIIRGWAALTTAVLAAVGSDVAAEFAENNGWLGGVLRDNHHESVLPALLIGLLAALSLALFVLFARIFPGDPLLSCIGHVRTRCFDIAGSLCGSVLCVVLMEGYETQFGGVSPFDPRSVVLSHALPLLLAFVVMGAILHFALRAAIGVASQASVFVAGIVVAFLRKLAAGELASGAGRAPAFALDIISLPFAVAHGSRGLRSPPRSISVPYLFA